MKLAVIAGEASGDLHASEVIRELRKLDTRLEAFGIGGDLLAAQGVTLHHHASKMGIVGLFNVIRHLGMFRKVFSETVDDLRRSRPDAVLLVDYPDFNLRLAREASRLGILVVYYISPQVWAWRSRRVRHIARYVDHMLVVFPFEEEFYRSHGVEVTYVGHPLIEQLEGMEGPRGLPAKDEIVRIALMPGSRTMEVSALLPAMLAAVKMMRAERPIESFVVRAPTIDRSLIEGELVRSGMMIDVVDQADGRSLASSHLALSSSGTATLEAAVIGVPVVVMYRLSKATYFLAKRLVRLPHFSLINILAGKKVVPELIQDDVNGANIASAARELLSPDRWAATRSELQQVRARLGGSGASERAARKLYKLMVERKQASETAVVLP